MFRQLSETVYDIDLEHVYGFALADTPPGETTLVDAGRERTTDRLIPAIEDEFGGVDRLIMTHAGGDHYGGLPAVMERFGPELCLPAGETEFDDVVDYEPDRSYDDGEVLPGGIESIQLRGHSVSPSALLLREERALISGDVLDGADRRGLPEGYLLPPPEMHNEDHAAAERNLARLLEYDFETVYVHHGSHVLEDAKEKLDRYVNFKDYR